MRKDFPQKQDNQSVVENPTTPQNNFVDNSSKQTFVNDTGKVSVDIDKTVTEAPTLTPENTAVYQGIPEKKDQTAFSLQEVVDMVRGNLSRGNFQRADELLSVLANS